MHSSGTVSISTELNTFRGYPTKRALSAMRKHGGSGPFGEIPSIYLRIHIYILEYEHISKWLRYIAPQYQTLYESS